MIQVRLDGVSKSFGPVRVLSDINLTFKGGEVVALMGENGAGKSTMMKIMSGVYPAGDFDGSIYVDDQKQSFKSPLDAEKKGIAIIHQELSFFPSLTVGENMVVGHWPSKKGFVEWSEVEKFSTEWLQAVGAPLKASMPMADLSVGSQQQVEIAKALSRQSRVIVFDEPTSALSPGEVAKLFDLIDRLRSEGRAIIYISHKMDEIFRVADRIVVLRDGQIVGDKPAPQWTQEDLIRTMVGRELNRLFPEKKEHTQKEIVLKIEHLEIMKGSKRVIGPISFDVRRGEILGFAGLLGAGRTELLKAIYGTPEFSLKGSVKLNGKEWRSSGPQKSLAHKVVYLSEDRKRESLLKRRSIQENLRISELSLKHLFAPLRYSNESVLANSRLSELHVKFHEQDQDILQLSGGNQQKVIIGRILEISPDVVMLDEPTRGVDVGAKYEIYQLLFDLAQAGKAILFVSSELPELLALCDRIMVLKQGEPMGCLSRSEFTPEKVMARAFGASEVIA